MCRSRPKLCLRRRSLSKLLAAARGKLRRSGISVERVISKHISEPHRGGILFAARGYAAPTELPPAVRSPVDYNDSTPQQPAKGVLLVRESRTRRIRRFTTERSGACPAARLEGIEQSWQRTDGPK